MRYKIIDWINNNCFGDITFPDFETAWEYIYEHIEDEEAYQDYEVIPCDIK